jgi:23S rRNA-intervening sequence protein
MKQWGKGDFQNLFEWQMVDNVSKLLNKTCEEMRLGRDEEWILEVIRESAENLPGSIIEGQESDYLAEYILGLSAARNALVVASYCFRFLKGQKLIEADKADYVDGRLEELEEVLAQVTDTLRASLASGQGQFSNN